jgi:NADP-dependent 3-hydroxy acid dehydrogenase YdfG
MPVKLKPLDRQVIVITGASSGIGLVKVGMMARLGTSVNKVMPRLGDKVSARQAGRQQRSMPARAP